MKKVDIKNKKSLNDKKGVIVKPIKLSNYLDKKKDENKEFITKKIIEKILNNAEKIKW